MTALAEFTEWVANRSHVDRSGRLPPGLRINLHSRSDAHSVKLCELLVEDLLASCAPLTEQAAEGRIAYGINYGFGWPNGKRKTLDLAIGIPLKEREPAGEGAIHPLKSRGRQGNATPEDQQFARLLIACEAKSVLTEHSKSQPRIFDELNGSHAIVHAGSQDTIAAGITLINIASTFVSPLRQSASSNTVVVTAHHQPEDAANMVQHLQDLPRKSPDNPVGFDAYCSFLMDVDNQGTVALWTAPPAPQPGDPDHYEQFLSDIGERYSAQYADLGNLPEPRGLSPEDALTILARKYPGLLDETGQLAVDADLRGAPELQAILSAIEQQARST